MLHNCRHDCCSGISYLASSLELEQRHHDGPFFNLLLYSNIWGNVSIYLFIITIYLFIYLMACDVIYIVIYNKVYLWYQELEWKWFDD